MNRPPAKDGADSQKEGIRPAFWAHFSWPCSSERLETCAEHKKSFFNTQLQPIIQPFYILLPASSLFLPFGSPKRGKPFHAHSVSLA
jgi:hypothetical protein